MNVKTTLLEFFISEDTLSVIESAVTALMEIYLI